MSEVECPVCDKLFEKTYHRQKYCEEHRIVKNRVEDGWCVRCKAEASLDGDLRCKKCIDYQREYERERYANDLEFREKRKKYSRKYRRERYANDPEYRHEQIKRVREYDRKLSALRKERTEYLESLPVDKLLSIAKDNLERGRDV